MLKMEAACTTDTCFSCVFLESQSLCAACSSLELPCIFVSHDIPQSCAQTRSTNSTKHDEWSNVIRRDRGDHGFKEPIVPGFKIRRTCLGCLTEFQQPSSPRLVSMWNVSSTGY